MSKQAKDSASLFEAEAQAGSARQGAALPHEAGQRGSGLKQALSAAQVADAKAKRFSDPGSKYNSILCPEIYEALKRKGMSKSQAAAISNAKCQE